MENYIIELYRNLAAIYDEIYGEEQRRKYWMFASQVGDRAVDVGCGVGLVFEVVQSYVVCLDISLDMLQMARRRRGELGELLAASYWLPPFRRGAFHTALFISSIDFALVDRAVEIWRDLVGRVVFEFRGVWRIG